ncbi:FecCD family ABC transporter permease [Serinibacter salmoneus]|uniref:Iron complex transport system permease protein n=1 Tax=Serinibacter salmoneus TaxID=556530 RepID=A0A2A9D0Q1_9MICO|nr:iron chelate uptake ABC transporter family permease subunit [Serinibacter salmoneus]PFG20223.1 iron complex transport system permease protein [Serinibacter salmoneus]
MSGTTAQLTEGGPPTVTTDQVAALRQARGRRRLLIHLGLAVALLGVVIASLCLGQTAYSPAQVWQVILGQDVQGAGFTVGTLRLPRTSLALLTGLCFGLGGATFQTMLRNPLASPDVIGVNAGASAAAVVCLVLLGLSATTTSIVAVIAALATAGAIYLMAYHDGVADTRFILIGIGVAAFLDSVIAYAISRASQWDLQVAMRWLTGNLNGASWTQVLPVLAAVVVLTPLLLGQSRNLDLLRLGDDTAAALGVAVPRTRLLLILAAVGLLAFATAATGPIAFVAFLSGPIAARIMGHLGSSLLASGLIGALLVLLADFAGQYAFGVRLPVGVITGALGAPFLLYLLTRTNRAGGSL